MRTAAQPKYSKNNPKRKVPEANPEIGLPNVAEAGSATTGSIYETSKARRSFISEVSNEEKYQLIAESAYFRSEKRSFAPGYELEDWLAAEAELEARLPGIGSSSRGERNANKRLRNQ